MLLQVVLYFQAVAEAGGNGHLCPDVAKVIEPRLGVQGLNQAIQGLTKVIAAKIRQARLLHRCM